MKIAVVTPYYKESTTVLHQCHQSVLTQSVSSDHFFVSDGFPNSELMKWNIKHTILPYAHDDYGNTPRGLGSILADIGGYDFIAYLDADNWFHPSHLSSLLNLYNESGANVCASFRTFHSLDGTELPIQERDELSLKHVDTSCFFLHRSAFDSLDIWLKTPKVLSPIGDRIFFAGLKNQKHKFAFTKQKTVAFRSQYKAHYLAANIKPPPNAKENVGTEAYKWLSTINGIKEVVARLGYIPV